MPQDSLFWAEIVPRADPNICRQCDDCAPVATCLAKAFRRDGADGVPMADENVCFGCYSCVAACRYGAILMPRKR